MFIPEMVAVVTFYGVRTIITPQVELLPAAYVFAQIMYLIIIHQVCLYDICSFRRSEMWAATVRHWKQRMLSFRRER